MRHSLPKFYFMPQRLLICNTVQWNAIIFRDFLAPKRASLHGWMKKIVSHTVGKLTKLSFQRYAARLLRHLCFLLEPLCNVAQMRHVVRDFRAPKRASLTYDVKIHYRVLTSPYFCHQTRYVAEMALFAGKNFFHPRTVLRNDTSILFKAKWKKCGKMKKRHFNQTLDN